MLKNYKIRKRRLKNLEPATFRLLTKQSNQLNQKAICSETVVKFRNYCFNLSSNLSWIRMNSLSAFSPQHRLKKSTNRSQTKNKEKMAEAIMRVTIIKPNFRNCYAQPTKMDISPCSIPVKSQSQCFKFIQLQQLHAELHVWHQKS